MGGMRKTKSAYLIPKSVRSMEEVIRWGQDNDIQMEIFGLELTDSQAETLTKQYTKDLENRLDEVNEATRNAWEKLKEIEENIDDPEKSSLTGVHNIIKSVRDQCADIMSTINRWGNEKDEFELQKLEAFVQKVSERFDRLKLHKLKRVDEGMGLE